MARNASGSKLRRRSQATSAVIASTAVTSHVLPRFVITRSTSTASLVALCDPHSATLSSYSARPSFVATMSSSTPTARATSSTTTNDNVTRRPRSDRWSNRSPRKRRRRGTRPSSSVASRSSGWRAEMAKPNAPAAKATSTTINVTLMGWRWVPAGRAGKTGSVSERRVGCSGFVYRDWRGTVYPAELPARAWLECYMTMFDTVELNTTFYRLPAATMVERWAMAAPPDFRYAVKVGRFGT